jgi:hypothetical protein
MPTASTTSPWHDQLVKYAGVDFGDPGPVLCDDVRARIIEDWLAWARDAGWMK